MDHGEATRLWEQFRRTNDSSVFEKLYRTHRLWLMRYCRARLSDHEAAEDVTDRVFTYLAIAKPACTVNFQSMLCFYARLRCLNYRSPRPSQPLPDVPAADPQSAAQVEQSELNERLDRALQRLSEQEREVVVLHGLAELSFTEIAEITGSARWKLARLYQRALRRLREILQESQI